MNENKFKVLISGGGTGGHIFPAVSIANALREKYPQVEIQFVGAEGRMEMEKVPAAGYNIIGLPIMGMPRKLSLKWFKFISSVIRSNKKARKIIADFRPDVAVGVGGYASYPSLNAASRAGVPCLLQEQNSYPGVVNKKLAGKVRKICVAYDKMERFFPAEKIMKTGNPVRQDIKNIDAKRNEAFEFFGLEQGKPVVLVVGGSLGAKTINESIAGGLKKFADAGVQLIWQTGKGYIETARGFVGAEPKKGLYVNDFIYKMDLAFAAADVIVSRAGASTISELCIVGKPVVFVPSPNVAEDHQTKNAMALVDKDAALMVKDVDARNVLVDKVMKLVSDMPLREKLSQNIKKLELLDAANVIAEEVYKLAYEK
ncbi:MAG: undecaprenyldiphospho-muramoylpentapeptide beta-N-acetylglucosaminyltransferase [Bacteroidales bacterium]|nr:undecaprenyldiphospho-muramoylpentapeptide beta-N-acetylglucosaminyltransferase [Bacteroidales bacterium]